MGNRRQERPVRMARKKKSGGNWQTTVKKSEGILELQPADHLNSRPLELSTPAHHGACTERFSRDEAHTNEPELHHRRDYETISTNDCSGLKSPQQPRHHQSNSDRQRAPMPCGEW